MTQNSGTFNLDELNKRVQELHDRTAAWRLAAIAMSGMDSRYQADSYPFGRDSKDLPVTVTVVQGPTVPGWTARQIHVVFTYEDPCRVQWLASVSELVTYMQMEAASPTRDYDLRCELVNALSEYVDKHGDAMKRGKAVPRFERSAGRLPGLRDALKQLVERCDTQPARDGSHIDTLRAHAALGHVKATDL